MAVGRQRQAQPAPVGRHILEALSTAALHPPRPAHRKHGFGRPTPIRPGFPVRARCRAKRGARRVAVRRPAGCEWRRVFTQPLWALKRGSSARFSTQSGWSHCQSIGCCYHFHQAACEVFLMRKSSHLCSSAVQHQCAHPSRMSGRTPRVLSPDGESPESALKMPQCAGAKNGARGCQRAQKPPALGRVGVAARSASAGRSPRAAG